MPSRTRPADRTLLVAVVVAHIVVIGIVGGFVLLLVHDDPVTWETATATHSSSDHITDAEAVRTLALLAVTMTLALRVPRVVQAYSTTSMSLDERPNVSGA